MKNQTYTFTPNPSQVDFEEQLEKLLFKNLEIVVENVDGWDVRRLKVSVYYKNKLVNSDEIVLT